MGKKHKNERHYPTQPYFINTLQDEGIQPFENEESDQSRELEALL